MGSKSARPRRTEAEGKGFNTLSDERSEKLHGTMTLNGYLMEKTNEISARIRFDRPLTRELCEEYGLRLFEPYLFRKLEMLGQGKFGEVWRCLEINRRIFTAVKFIKVRDETLSYENIIMNIGSYLVEKSLLERVSQIGSNNFFAKFLGGFFCINQDGEVNELVIVTEAGDFNLEELISTRKALLKTEFPYTLEEVKGYLAHFIKGLKLLKEHRIYHSDIKTKNIVFSIRRNSFLIIDFGVSKIIPREELAVPLEVYGREGTKFYCAPEIKEFWDTEEETFKKYPKEKRFFNPFKSDIWSLATCLERMLGPVQSKSFSKSQSTDNLLTLALSYMKKPDCYSRYDATQIGDLLMLEEIKTPDFNLCEKKFVNELLSKRVESIGYEDLFKRYRYAGLPEEKLVIALKWYQNVSSSLEQINFEEKFVEIASIFGKLGKAFEDCYKYQDALNCYEKRFFIFSNSKGIQNSKKLASSLFHLSHIKNLIGLYIAAKVDAEESLRIRKTIFEDERSKCIADNYYLLGFIEGNLGNYEKALAFYERNLEIQRKLIGTKEPVDLLSTYHNIAFIYSNIGRYQEALELNELVVAHSREENKTENNQRYSVSLLNLARLLSNLAFYDESIRYFKGVIEINLKISANAENFYFALAVRDLGALYGILGNFEHSLENLNLSLELLKKLFKGENHDRLATVFHEIGKVYSKMALYYEANDMFKRALDLRKAVLKREDHLDVISTIHEVARLKSLLGDYQESLELHRQNESLRLWILKKEENPILAMTRLEIAKQLFNLGDIDGAHYLFKQVLENLKKVYVNELHPSIADVYYEIAQIENHFGNQEQSLQYFKKALELRRKIFSTDEHPDVAEALREIAFLTFVPESFKVTINKLNDVLYIQRKVYGKEIHPELVLTFMKLAAVYEKIGNTEKSEEILENSRAIMINMLKSGNHPLIDKIQVEMNMLRKKASPPVEGV